MSKEIKEVDYGKVFINFMIIIILIIPTYMSVGFCGMKLWNWFIVPLGVTQIDMLQAMGIFVVISFLRMDFNVNKDFTNENSCGMLTMVIVSSWLSLLTGSIIKWLM